VRWHEVRAQIASLPMVRYETRVSLNWVHRNRVRRVSYVKGELSARATHACETHSRLLDWAAMASSTNTRAAPSTCVRPAVLSPSHRRCDAAGRVQCCSPPHSRHQHHRISGLNRPAVFHPEPILHWMLQYRAYSTVPLAPADRSTCRASTLNLQ